MGGTVTQLLNLQGMLFILIIAGMVAGKKKLVSAEGRRCLTNAESIYGAAGLSYTAIYLIPLRIVMWSAGISFFSKVRNWKAMVLKVALHPCMIAVYLGLPIFFFQIPLPHVISETLTTLGDCCTAMSLLIIGMLLTDVDWKTMFSVKLLLFSALRLIVLPALVWGFCLVAHMDPLVTGVSVILTGMPAGTTTALLAAQYHRDAELGSKVVVLTTLLSLFTITGWSLVLN